MPRGISPFVFPSAGLAAEWGNVYSGGAFEGGRVCLLDCARDRCMEKGICERMGLGRAGVDCQSSSATPSIGKKEAR